MTVENRGSGSSDTPNPRRAGVYLRVVYTDEEADQLSVGSVLFDVDFDVITRADEGWRFWGDESDFTEEAVICLPAIVLHAGGETDWFSQ